MYAGVGIMAGSYAHNIKNLLVRPLDLLRRCIANKALDQQTSSMLGEVENTLGAVAVRLEQILNAVRRQGDKFEPVRFDLKELVCRTVANWNSIADDKWKIDLEINVHLEGESFINADPSHLQQILENLIFNARDAVFEQRLALREQARSQQINDIQKSKVTIIEAASWRGRICFDLSSLSNNIILEVRDNGAGMTPEVVARCTEAYFSTRRESAIFEGLGSGMGLGLSFVQSVLDKSGGKMVVSSQKGLGTTFKIQYEMAL
jgi:signal transduction histidine kinase